jgi:glyoxylase I family protein
VAQDRIGGVDHVSFLVRDLEGALAFYCDVLGCELLPRPDLGFPGAWLRLGGSEVHLITPMDGVDPGTAPDTPSGFANHVAFRIDDHGAVLGRLRRLGLDACEGEVGIQQIFVQDPAGNVLELIERR